MNFPNTKINVMTRSCIDEKELLDCINDIRGWETDDLYKRMDHSDINFYIEWLERIKL